MFGTAINQLKTKILLALLLLPGQLPPINPPRATSSIKILPLIIAPPQTNTSKKSPGQLLPIKSILENY